MGPPAWAAPLLLVSAEGGPARTAQSRIMRRALAGAGPQLRSVRA